VVAGVEPVVLVRQTRLERVGPEPQEPAALTRAADAVVVRVLPEAPGPPAGLQVEDQRLLARALGRAATDLVPVEARGQDLEQEPAAEPVTPAERNGHAALAQLAQKRIDVLQSGGRPVGREGRRHRHTGAGIAVDRERQAGGLGRAPIDLGGEQMGAPVVALGGKPRHGDVLGAHRAAVGAEEPEPPPDDRPAHAHARVALVAGVHVGVRQAPPPGAAQPASAVEPERLAPELIAARPGDHVHDPTQGAAILRLVPTRLDHHLLDEVRGQIAAGAGAVRVGDVHPVDVVDVLRTGAAGDVDLVAVGAGVDFGEERQEGVEVPLHGEGGEQLRRQVSSARRGRRVEHPGRRGDDDGRQLDGAPLQPHDAQRGRGPQVDDDPLDPERLVAHPAQGERQGVGRQPGQLEVPPGVRHGAADRPLRPAQRRDGHVSQRGPGGVRHPALHRTGDVLGRDLQQRHAREEHGGDQSGPWHRWGYPTRARLAGGVVRPGRGSRARRCPASATRGRSSGSQAAQSSVKRR